MGGGAHIRRVRISVDLDPPSSTACPVALSAWPSRLVAACTRALGAATSGYRSVKSILVTGLDRLPPDPPALPDRRLIAIIRNM